jgi:hypothetical protein
MDELRLLKLRIYALASRLRELEESNKRIIVIDTLGSFVAKENEGTIREALKQRMKDIEPMMIHANEYEPLVDIKITPIRANLADPFSRTYKGRRKKF